LEAEIRLSYRNEREAETVTKAISPDNMDVPKGLQIDTLQHDSEVNTKIKCQARLATLIATIDDLLACVSVAEKTFKIAKQ
jgi:tRNA threonylcarbamoyladenosine modification (KEOPS) complex  Pcc1 subunit